jgi:hypothetical protein
MPQRTFDEVVLPHPDAAFTYAGCLTRDKSIFHAVPSRVPSR